jgi:hypothetical protein
MNAMMTAAEFHALAAATGEIIPPFDFSAPAAPATLSTAGK